VKEIASKNASADFQNFCRLASKKGAESAVFFRLRGNTVLETVWLHCDEAQQVGCLRGLEGCPLVLDAGIQSRFARRRWWRGRWGGYEHCGTRQTRSTLRFNASWLGWLFAELLLQHPNRSQQAASGARRMMSASCEVTQGVGDTWAACPTLLRGIWARSRSAGFVVVFDFKLTFHV